MSAPAIRMGPGCTVGRGLVTAAHRRHLDHRAGPLVLIAAWILLVPLAAARPVDPTWITGLYDDGDFDNVVTLIGSLLGVSEAPLRRVARPDWHGTPLPASVPSQPVTLSPLRPVDRSPPQP